MEPDSFQNEAECPQFGLINFSVIEDPFQDFEQPAAGSGSGSPCGVSFDMEPLANGPEIELFWDGPEFTDCQSCEQSVNSSLLIPTLPF